MGGVFINYRGRDAGGYASLLYGELRKHLGEDDVFLDHESIEAGSDFVEALVSEVRMCAVLLALVGSDWLTASDRLGRRLIDDSTDWIRRELVEAFRAGVRVIPVLVDDAGVIEEEALPTDISQLGRCQFRRLRYRESSSDLARIASDVVTFLAVPGRTSSRPASRPARDAVTGQLNRWKRYPVGIDHDRLLGADGCIGRIVDTASSLTSAPALTVSGEGGRGKTAVTYEAVDVLAATGRFSRIVWASARNTVFRTAPVDSPKIGTVDWLQIVRDIADQLGCERGPVRRLWERELRDHIHRLHEDERVLLVVDNLEGIDDAEGVLDRVQELGLSRPHKLIATTRWAVRRNDYDVPDMPVQPLSEADSTLLARLIGRGNAELEAADNATLKPIYTITEGNPFLIKLLVRRFLSIRRPLDEVIRELTSLHRPADYPQPLGPIVREYLYKQSLDQLAVRFDHYSAGMLMASFCFAPRGSTGAV